MWSLGKLSQNTHIYDVRETSMEIAFSFLKSSGKLLLQAPGQMEVCLWTFSQVSNINKELD